MKIDNIIKTENFHSFEKLLRTTPWCLGFIYNLKRRILKTGVNEHIYIDTAKFHQSKLLLLKVNQRDYISQESFKDVGKI